MFFFWKKGIQTKSPKYIFHIHDRIIYELTDSDSKPTKYHDIDTDTKNIKYNSREKERDWKRNHRNKCSTSIQEKENNDNGNYNSSISEGFFDISESLLDKPCLTKYIIFEFYSFGKCFLYFCYFCEKSIREFYGISIWNFGNADNHSFSSIDESISSSLAIFSNFYTRYITQNISIWKRDRSYFFFCILYRIEFDWIFRFFIDSNTRPSWIGYFSERTL